MAGKACLTFGGIETFVGAVSGSDGRAQLAVERALPIFPMTQDVAQLWQPSDHTRTELMRRLTEEAARRGQPIPVIAQVRPEPTEGYKRRMRRRALLAAPAQLKEANREDCDTARTR